MRTPVMLKRLVVVCVVIASLVAMKTDSAIARPFYQVLYEEHLRDNHAVSCQLCHAGNDKKQLDDYAKQLGKLLVEKDVRDRDRIKTALDQLGRHPDDDVQIAVRAGVVDRPVRQFDDDGNEVAIEARRFFMTHQILDQLILGSNKTLEAAQRDWELQLQRKLNSLQTKYQLDAEQRRKLQLAGRGDIKRVVSQANALHDQLGTDESPKLFEPDEHVRLQQTAVVLRQRMTVMGGLIYDQSLLSKTIPKVIAPKLAAEYVAEQDRERERLFEMQLEDGVASLERYLILHDEQKESLKKLIRSQVAPPAQVNQDLKVWVYFHLSNLPNDKLSKVLDEAQMGKFGLIQARVPEYEQSLRDGGLLPGESNEERQEDSP